MEKFKLYLIALRNVFLGGNIISLSLITKPSLFIGNISILLFYFKTLSNKGRLEQKNPDEILNSNKKYEIKIDTDCYFWGNDPSYVKDIITLCLITKLIEAKNIFEIGTLDGYTALHFAMNSSENTKVYSLDLPLDGSEAPSLRSTVIDELHQKGHSIVRKYKFRIPGINEKVVILFGDSAKFDYKPYLKKIDLFFIDGAHSYEYVKSDTEKAFECVRGGGIIVWHDYGRMGVNGVTKWLHELNSKGYKIYSVPGSSLAFHIVG